MSGLNWPGSAQIKIKHIEAIPLVRKLATPFHGGTYYIDSRNTIVTRVELEGGAGFSRTPR